MGDTSDHAPRVVIGAIAAGEKVLSSKKSNLARLLKATYGDALAIEMEGHGFLHAVRLNYAVLGLVVRGISDLVDDKAEADASGMQPIAAQRAAAFAFQVLAKFTLPAPDRGQAKMPPPESHTVLFLAPARPPYDLVGRSELLRILKDKLFSGGNLALSALKGLPGVGKTALAVALAYDPEVLSHFTDGVLWAGVGRDASEAVILSRLGLWGTALDVSPAELEKLSEVQTRQERIQAAIGQRKMLLVIDDVWKIEQAWQFKVGGPNCAYLLTTRLPEIATRYAGEGMMVVQELDEQNGLLLLRQLAPSVVDAEPEEARKLVHAVSGLPLALTLMGNYLRVKASSEQPHRVREALDRLSQVQERLTIDEPQERGYNPSLPINTPLSLKAAIAVSDEALDGISRMGLRAISIFPAKPNTFSQEAALAVSALPIRMLDTLTDYGLLESSRPSRYMLHQTIVNYASANRTDTGIEARMVEHFVHMAEEHKMDYEMLETEMGNVQAALLLASESKRYLSFVRGVNAFCDFLDARGLYTQAENYLKQAQTLATSLDDKDGLINVLLHLGKVAAHWGDYKQAQTHLQEGLKLAHQFENPARLAALLQSLGAVAIFQGNYGEAEVYLQEGLKLARQLDDPKRIAALLQNLGVIEGNRGDYVRVEAYLQEGLTLARQLGERELIVRLLLNLAALAGNQGKLKQAEDYLSEGLALARQIKHREYTVALLANLGALASDLGNYMQAETYLQEGVDLARQLKNPERLAFLLQNLGTVIGSQGDYERAQTYLSEGLELARRFGTPEHIVGVLLNLSEVTINQGDYERAQTYLSEGLELADQLSHREHIIGLRRNLGMLAEYCGDYEQAEVSYQEGLELARKLEHPRLIATTLNSRGELHLKRSVLDAASKDFHEALETAPQESQDLRADALLGLAQIEVALGNYKEARRQGEMSLEIFENIGHKKRAVVKAWLATLPQPEDGAE